MRYDTPIYFQSIEREYDETTGDYSETLVETMRLASVQSTNIETLNLVYGGLKQNSLTVHLQNKYTEDYDSIRIGDTKYRVDHKIPLRVKEGLIISGND